jgi:hypothetical protein
MQSRRWNFLSGIGLATVIEGTEEDSPSARRGRDVLERLASLALGLSSSVPSITVASPMPLRKSRR